MSHCLSSQPGSPFGSTLKPLILPEILQAQQEEVRRVFWAECVRPRGYIHEYDKYASLVSKQAEADVEQFLSEQHCFQEIMAEVMHYQQLVDQIQYTSCKVLGSLNPPEMTMWRQYKLHITFMFHTTTC